MPTATLNTLSFFVHRTRQIYSLPAVTLEVLELTNHPRVDCPKLKQCIEHDPALVGKILRVVNSSLFGLGSNVTDLNQAIALLGIKPLKLLVLGFSLSEVVFRGQTGEAMQNAWRHTLTRAVAARELCETAWHVSGDEAFTAALLAELGKFVLLDELKEPYATLLTSAVEDQDSLYRLEQASLGFDHAELSAELLSHWNLPESLSNAVRLTSRPDQIAMLERPEILLPAAVYLAGLVADLVVDRRHHCLHELVREPASPSRSTALDELRPSHELLKELVARVQERVHALAEALSFELPAGTDYRDVLAAAHEKLSQLAGDAACVVARQWPIVERTGADVASVSSAVARYVNRYAETAETARPRPMTAAVSHADTPSKKSPERGRSLPAAREPQSNNALFESKLSGRLETVIGICRQARCALSLLLFEIDRFQELGKKLHPLETKTLVQRLNSSASDVDHPGAVCLQLGESKFALVVADCDRRAAVTIGRQLVRNVATTIGTSLQISTPLTLSVGVASVSTPSKNFPSDNLLKAAARCLDAAKLSGGNTCKSIDVY